MVQVECRFAIIQIQVLQSNLRGAQANETLKGSCKHKRGYTCIGEFVTTTNRIQRLEIDLPFLAQLEEEKIIRGLPTSMAHCRVTGTLTEHRQRAGRDLKHDRLSRGPADSSPKQVWLLLTSTGIFDRCLG
jgi:hypothetical protein